jgi:hypothetical protein
VKSLQIAGGSVIAETRRRRADSSDRRRIVHSADSFHGRARAADSVFASPRQPKIGFPSALAIAPSLRKRPKLGHVPPILGDGFWQLGRVTRLAILACFAYARGRLAQPECLNLDPPILF